MKIDPESLFCPYCGAKINRDLDTTIPAWPENPAPSGSFTEVPAEPLGSGGGVPMVPQKMPVKRRIGITLAVTLPVALVLFLVFGYFFIHIYAPATCTKAAICKICGKSGKKALGHDWGGWEVVTSATCLESGEEERVCKRDEYAETREIAALGHDWNEWKTINDATCEDAGSKARVCKNDPAHIERETLDPLDHDWLPATYDAPETCSRCGETQGEVKGYVGYLWGEWADDPISLDDCNVHPFLLDEQVNSCRKLTMGFTLSDVQGDIFGNWNLFARGLDGKWFWIASFKVDSDMVDQRQVIPFTFSTPVSFDALVTTCGEDPYGDCSWSVSVGYTAQVQVD